MASSPDSLLRLIRSLPMPPLETPRILGVDDWALRKGQTYATVLVDLEEGKIIELLPDRKSETLIKWLQEHPGVEVISRDRGSAYISAATIGAPQAQQVADRFHLVKNLVSALELILSRHKSQLRKAAQSLCEIQEVQSDQLQQEPPQNPTSKAEQLRLYRLQARVERYERVKSLDKEGWSPEAIALQTDLSSHTVRKYLTSGLPSGKRPPRRKEIDKYGDHLKMRWEQGCHDGLKLWQEVRQKGFGGSARTVQRYIKGWRPDGKRPASEVPAQARAEVTTVRQAVWLMLRTKKPLTEEEERFKLRLFKQCPELSQVAASAMEFQDILVGRLEKPLTKWMEHAEELCGELARFVKGLRKDGKAVENAVTLLWSNGPVEGHVNRIKTVKRQMYGRASLELLRRRLILDN